MGLLLELYTADSIQHAVGSETMLPPGKAEKSDVSGAYGQRPVVLMGAGRAVDTPSAHTDVNFSSFPHGRLC